MAVPVRASAKVEEDLMQNPFMQVLRASFEGIYRQAAERGERTALLVPCAECLEEKSFGQVFAETHLLQATCVPGCYMNLLGQGVEIKDTSVSTHLGFREHRTCEVLQSEFVREYDMDPFRVLVIDRPLIGRYTLPGSPAADRAQAKTSTQAAPGPMADTDDLLDKTPGIRDDFFDQVHRFRKTFVQVAGCESSTAERIREIAAETVQRLSKHHKLSLPSQIRQVDFNVSRQAYAVLNAWVFPHLSQILSEHETRLQDAIQSYSSSDELLNDMPEATLRGLGRVDIRECSKELELMEKAITPHEKVACIDKAHSLLQQKVAEGAKITQAAGDSPVEITGDDVLSLFIMAVHGSQVKQFLAHIAHVEMYLEGAAGRSGSSVDEAGYAVCALQAALEFFLRSTEEPRPAISSPNRGFSPQGFGAGLDSALDKDSTHLQGHVRQARAPGVPRYGL